MFAQSNGVATISSGKLQGKQCERNPGVWAFLGIPYAEAPVGAYRWRAPRPVTPWDGVRDATRYAPDCPQVTLPKGSFYQVEFYPNEKVMDEAQGLALNVWTPAKPGEQLPVYVWIHGGQGHRSGDHQLPPGRAGLHGAPGADARAGRRFGQLCVYGSGGGAGVGAR